MRAEPLAHLRQVGGVVGSFTCAETGQLLASDMPERYSVAALESTAARVTNLLDTIQDAVDECQSLRLSFAEHLLFVRRYRRGLLCVLTRGALDRPLLQAAEEAVIAELLSP